MSDTLWDVFTYFDEPEVLTIRLREFTRLADMGIEVVHVAIESHETFSGQRKPLHLQAMMDLPKNVVRFVAPPFWSNVPADREREQRDFAPNALDALGVKGRDRVLFGDVDEIPDPLYIAKAWGNAGRGLVSMRSPYSSLLASVRLPLADDVWNHRWPVMLSWDRFQYTAPSVARDDSKRASYVYTQGWHLSSVGGPSRALSKVGAFVHHDEPWRDGLDRARLIDLATRCRDIADRFTQTPYDSLADLPLAIREDPERYAAMITPEAW